MQRFDDVQFFGSHRGVGFVTWARALNGKPMRIFAFGEADVVANVGEQTPEETKLTFLDLSGLAPSDASEKMFRVADEQTAERDSLVASGLSRREARARVCKRAAMRYLMKRTWLTLPRFGASTPVGYRFGISSSPAGEFGAVILKPSTASGHS
jgi:hypothetical protein